LFNGMLAMWSAGLPALLDLFPSSKLIACVRNVAWVMDSRERLFRANPYENTRLFNDDSERVAVESRRTVLPPDLFEKFPALSFWHARPGSAANVIRLANAPTPDLASVKGS